MPNNAQMAYQNALTEILKYKGADGKLLARAYRELAGLALKAFPSEKIHHDNR